MTAAALEVQGLSKSFGGLRAVNEVSFNVPAGSLSALIGPNGAGKTTLFNLITNVFKPDRGSVHLFGERIDTKSPNRIAERGLIRTFQTARVFPGMTVLENLLVGAHQRMRSNALSQMLWLGRSRLEERDVVADAEHILQLIGLSAYRHTAATTLPMGAQKLLEVARAVMARPRLLLLDEPAAGLNDSETAELADLLSALNGIGTTVLVVEHNMSLVMSVAHDIIVLEAGSVIATGTPAQIQSNHRVIEAYIGQEAEDA